MQSVKIIAEAGVNHNGSIDLAKQLIDAASIAGADIIKFQTYKTDNLIVKDAPKAAYQQQTTNQTQTQYEMLKKYELSTGDHRVLIDYCQQKKIKFLSSAFDLESLDLLVNELRLETIKFGSGEITNGPLLLQAAQWNKKIILSTGMSTLSDIENALAVLAFGFLCDDFPKSLNDCYRAYFSKDAQELLAKNVILLHCTTEYPAPFAEVNLKAMDTMKQAFGLTIGFSDHTTGIATPIAAVARGAMIIEKHFTLDKNLAGPDHQASIDPEELTEMVKSIRQIEKALGNGFKLPSKSELQNKDVIIKRLIAADDIKQGDFFSRDNLTLKRSAQGISGIDYWRWLGKEAKRNYQQDEAVIE